MKQMSYYTPGKKQEKQVQDSRSVVVMRVSNTVHNIVSVIVFSGSPEILCLVILQTW